MKEQECSEGSIFNYNHNAGSIENHILNFVLKSKLNIISIKISDTSSEWSEYWTSPGERQGRL